MPECKLNGKRERGGQIGKNREGKAESKMGWEQHVRHLEKVSHCLSLLVCVCNCWHWGLWHVVVGLVGKHSMW